MRQQKHQICEIIVKHCHKRDTEKPRGCTVTVMEGYTVGPYIALEVRRWEEGCGGGFWALLPWQQVSMWNNSCGTECYGVFGPPPSSPRSSLCLVLHFLSRPDVSCCTLCESYYTMTNKTLGPRRAGKLPDWSVGGGAASVCAHPGRRLT